MEKAKLTGSEKQISWAMDIREKVQKEINPMHAEAQRTSKKNLIELLNKIQNKIDTEESSRWWIDNQYATLQKIMKELGISKDDIRNAMA